MSDEYNLHLLHKCFDTTDWQMFCVAAYGDIDEYTDSVTAYISMFVDDIVLEVNVRAYPT